MNFIIEEIFETISAKNMIKVPILGSSGSFTMFKDCQFLLASVCFFVNDFFEKNSLVNSKSLVKIFERKRL